MEKNDVLLTPLI